MVYTPGGTASDPNAPDPATRFPGTGPAGVDRYWWKSDVIVSESDANRGLFGLLPSQKMSTLGQMILDFDQKPSDPAEVDALQSLLWAGGFYTGKKPTYTPGQRDAATRKAFIAALKEASREHLAFGAFLNDRATARAETFTEGPTHEPFVAKVTNPDDLKRILQETFETKIGTGVIPPEKLDAMVAAFQGEESASQKAVYDANYSGSGYGPGGTVVQPPDPTTFADTQAKKIDPTAYDAYAVLDKFSVLQKILAGGQG